MRFFIGLTFLLLLSCQKEKNVQLDFQEIQSPIALTDGVVSGGKLWLVGGKVWQFGSFTSFENSSAIDYDSITYGFLKTINFLDSSRCVTSGMDGILRVYYPTTKGVYFIDKTETLPVNCVAMAPNGQKGITVGGAAYLHGHILLFDLNTVYKKHTLASEINHVVYRSPSEVWMSGTGIVLYSSDGGENLDTTAIIGDNFIKTVFEGNIGYAIGSYGSVWTSDDNGKNWTENSSLKKYIHTRNTISDALIIDHRLWICGDNGLLAYSENKSDWILADNLPLYKFNKIIRFQNKLWILGDKGIIRINE